MALMFQSWEMWSLVCSYISTLWQYLYENSTFQDSNSILEIKNVLSDKISESVRYTDDQHTKYPRHTVLCKLAFQRVDKFDAGLFNFALEQAFGGVRKAISVIYQINCLTPLQFIPFGQKPGHVLNLQTISNHAAMQQQNIRGMGHHQSNH